MRRGESGRVRSIGRIEGTKKAAAGRRVAVLMSGGVDSAASAVLLLRQGYDVAGLTMRIPRSGRAGCATETAGNRIDSVGRTFTDFMISE